MRRVGTRMTGGAGGALGLTVAASLSLGLALTLAAGCGGGSAVGSGSGGGPVTGNQDDYEYNGLFQVDEAHVVAEVQGDQLVVDVPVSDDSGAELRGEVRVELVGLDGETIASGTGKLAIAGVGVARVAMPAAGLADPGTLEVTQLLHYEVSVGKTVAQGYRSLFYSMPKLDLRAQMPSTMLEGGASKLRVFALDPTRDGVLPGVKVALKLTSPGTDPVVLSAMTGDDGSAVFDVPAQDAGQYTMETSAEQGDTVVATMDEDVEVVRDNRVLVTSDKPIYKPGQTMHLRALALKKPLLHAVAGVDATIEVYDGEGNMVFRKYEPTNDFGIASTDFKLATEVNTGTYEVKVTVGDTTTSKSVEVKPYALPKFKVATDLGVPFALAGETLHGTVSAQYFFGKPVAGGQVELVARGTDVGLTEFAHLNGTTNDSGIYTFDLDLPEYLVGTGIENGNATATFEITVTDTAGQVEQKLASLVVASQALNLAAIPESGAIVPGLDNGLYVFATTPLGAPVAATFTVKANGQPATVEVLGDGMSRVTVTVPAGADAALDLVVTAKTDEGDAATQSFHFVPGQASEGLLLRTDRALYRVGDTVELSVVSTAQTGRLFLDVIKDGQTQLTAAVDLKDGRATYSLDLDGALVGDVVIEAYHVAADASIVRDKKLIFVRDAKGLDINIEADQAQYEPGDDATLTFQVSDTDGLPAVAALGVQIVDEAVYALTEMRPGLLETYFLIQKALQEPHYQIDNVSFDLTGVVNQPPEDAGAQTVAGAAFAALDTDDAAQERSSWSEALKDLSPTLQPAFEKHRKAVEDHFTALADSGALTYENARDFLDAQDVFYDYWGNPYTFEASEDWDGVKASMHSMGPDEVDGTVDDWTGTVSVYSYQRMWDEDGAFNGPPQAGAGGGMDAATSADAGAVPAPEGEGGPVKVRKDFPETLYFNPALITDENGQAQVTLKMADSITEWRVSTVANTVNGALGSATGGITVFQDFFVDISFPASLTQNDEVTFPIAIYNYLPTPQTVTVEVAPASWFTLLGGSSQTVELAPSQVASVSFPVRVDEVGVHALTVTGYGSQMNDAVQRVVRVKPDGKRFDDSASGVLKGSATHSVSFPAGTIPNSQSLLVKVYPGIMAQAVEGLDSMLQEPHGCFEQTTASNWPNTLVLDYLRSTGQVSPEIELKALDYVQQGYQRLLTFECTGGGFVWFGDPSPANVVLSAMGVLEFSDMARVIDVDPAVIARTADWLAGAQKADGSWHTDQGSEFATVQYDDVKTTAFSTWALASAGVHEDAVQAALGWLAGPAADPTTDVYALAMMGNAFAAADPHAQATGDVLDALAAQAKTDDEGHVWWTYTCNDMNYGGFMGGEGAQGGQDTVNPTSIEVTALAVQAFLAAGEHLDLVQGAVGFLAGQKDGLGNYGTTHATILTLRAMIQSLANKTEEGEGTLTVSVNGTPVSTLAITEENRNVFQQIDLTDQVAPSGQTDPDQPANITVSYEGTGNLMYQVLSAYYLPIDDTTMPAGEVMDISVSYDKTQLQVNDTVTATALVRNLTQGQLDMVLVDLGIPPGFSVIPDKLTHMVEAGTIMKFELAGQQLSVYLDKMTPGQELSLAYDLVANYPVKAKAPSSSAYLYYDEDTKAETPGAEMEVQ